MATAGCGIAISGSFLYAKDLVKILESPVASQGVRFLALSPGEYFFTTWANNSLTAAILYFLTLRRFAFKICVAWYFFKLARFAFCRVMEALISLTSFMMVSMFLTTPSAVSVISASVFIARDT